MLGSDSTLITEIKKEYAPRDPKSPRLIGIAIPASGQIHESVAQGCCSHKFPALPTQGEDITSMTKTQDSQETPCVKLPTGQLTIALP